MRLRETLGKIFERDNRGLGWFVFWRIAVVMIPVMVISRLIAEQAGPNPVAGIAALFFLPVGGNVYLIPVAIPLVLFLWHWAGKMAMAKKLGVHPRGFIGWALYWRVVLLSWVGLLALALVLVPVAVLGGRAGGFDQSAQMVFLGIIGLIALPALIYWQINVIGFVVKKVAVKIPGGAPSRAEKARPGPGEIRHFSSLFNAADFGMNWMFAGAFVAAGLAGYFLFPLVNGILTGRVDFGSFSYLPGLILSLVVTGAALTWFLHRVKSEWQVVLFYSLVGVAALVVIESPLEILFGLAAEDQPFLSPEQALSRFGFAVFFSAGLLLGLRVIGPNLQGFIIGIGAAQLVYSLAINPFIWAAFLDVEVEILMTQEGILRRLLFVVFDASITGALLWWACGWHLKKHGLRLPKKGFSFERV